MAFCSNCGINIGNSKFCSECGEKNLKHDISTEEPNEIEKKDKNIPKIKTLEDLKKHLNQNDNSPILGEITLNKVWEKRLKNPLLKFRTLDDEDLVLTKGGIYMSEITKSYSFEKNQNNPLELKYFDASKRFDSKNGKYTFRFKNDVDKDSLDVLLNFINKISESRIGEINKVKQNPKTKSQQNLETESKNKSVLTFVVIIISVVISFVVLSENKSSSPSNIQIDNNKTESSIPDGVSAACFCMDALSGGSIYGSTYEQKSKCRKMFICWDNAQADCLMGTSQIWYECID